MKKQTFHFTFFSVLIAAIIIVSGFFSTPVLDTARKWLLTWAVFLFAILQLFTTLNSILRSIRTQQNDFTDLLIHAFGFFAFLAVLVLGTVNGLHSEKINSLAEIVQLSVESPLVGLICPALIFALFMVSKRKKQGHTKYMTAFVIGFFIFLFIDCGIQYYVPAPKPLQMIISWLRCIPTGGFYGLLIGVAIGSIITGLRSIFFGKNPYKENK